MKSNHFSFFALIAILFGSCHVTAMKSVSPIVIKPIAPAEEYYTKANLEVLRKQGIQNHSALLILIDQDQFETPSHPTLQALSAALRHSIYSEGIFPILVSASILYNVKERSDGLFYFLHNGAWDLYDVPQSQFILLVPKKYLEINPNHGLQLNKLPNISNLLPAKNETTSYESLNNIFSDKKGSQFNATDLNKIFIDKKDSQTAPIFDIWITGHGLTNTMIGGLSPKQINEMLRFFDERINTGVVNLLSCYISGKNISVLQFEESGVARTHNFILIIDGIAETPAYAQHFEFYNIVSKLFNNAALLSNRGEALSRILKDLNIFHQKTGSAHGSENIPQVWLPNGLGFQTFNIDERILVIGNVLAKIHEENRTPIIIRDKQAVLIYPPYIKSSMRIGFGSVTGSFETMEINKIWKNLPMLIDPPFLDELLRANNSPSPFTGLLDTFSTVKKIIPNIGSMADDLFPAFIGMQPSRSCRISEIRLGIASPPLAGVMKFIRDSFLSMPERSKSDFVFFIDTLTGYNDISILLKASQLYSKSKEHPLEIALRSLAEKAITLKNVIIILSKNDFNLSFILNNKVWSFNHNESNKRPFWNFTEEPMTVEEHEKNYLGDINAFSKNENISQKSISETLMQKQQDILNKKARALKIQEIFETRKKAGWPLPAISEPTPSK